MHCLITGPAGSGKSSIARALLAKGFQTFDADTDIPDLAGFDIAHNRPATAYPVNADHAWLTEHHWLWSIPALQEFLGRHTDQTIFLCGGADNVHEVLHNFDMVFYLRANGTLLQDRLAEEQRQHLFAFGSQEFERQYVKTVMQPYYERSIATQPVVIIDADQELPLVVEDIVRHVLEAQS